MARKGGNKKRCERYKLSGHKEENKMKRQKRHEKRMARFAQRKADGKSYEYKPIPFAKDSKEYNKEALIRMNKMEESMSHKTDYQRVRSAMDILKKEMEQRDRQLKKEMKATKGRRDEQSDY